jgi:hypothetical protein
MPPLTPEDKHKLAALRTFAWLGSRQTKAVSGGELDPRITELLDTIYLAQSELYTLVNRLEMEQEHGQED